MTVLLSRQSLGDLLRRTAARTPEKLALVNGPTSLTYRAFDDAVTRVAAALAGRGVAVGDRVAVVSRNSASFAVLRFALARLGAVLVPINFMLQAGEIAHILRHSRATRLCVDSEFAATAGEAAGRDTQVTETIWLPGPTPTPQPPGTVSFHELMACPDPFEERDFDGRALAQIMYTSGTESLPKGVMLTHDAIITQYLTCLVDLEITADDRMLHALPMYHCAQLDVFLGPSIHAGGFNLIIGQPAAETVLELIEAETITSFFAPPTVWISLLRSPSFDRRDLSSLRKGYYGASIMPVEVLLEMQRRLPQLRLWNCYGQTEMAPMATVLKPEDQLRKAGSAGRPTLHVETRVIRDNGSDAAVGEVGEIVHRSPHVMSGYLDDPEKTAAAFEGGWFHSGDLGVIDADGYLAVVDRKKDMIKTGGENVASREVEEAIYRLDGVSEVAVVGLPHPRWIEAVTAIVVLKPGASVEADDVLRHCAASLASYKRPKRVFFAEALPKNASGKVMKRELRLAYEEAAARVQA